MFCEKTEFSVAGLKSETTKVDIKGKKM